MNFEPNDSPNFFATGSIDLTNCDREPIHIPGSIQPHGILLTLQEPELRILQVSQNIEKILKISTDEILGQSLDRVFPKSSVEQIVNYLTHEDLEVFNPFELKCAVVCPEATPLRSFSRRKGLHIHYTSRSSQRWQFFRAVMHRSSGVVVLELEPRIASGTDHALTFYHRFKTAVNSLRHTHNLQDLAQTLAQATRTVNGFDRVMVYQFQPDYSGVIIAEAKADHLESFLGLHYPATDIPLQSRKLYYENWIRLIPDAGYEPVPLVPVNNPLTDQPIDLSHAGLRSVSPLHIEYMKNLGITASMSISLINEKQLWGLISCHNYSPKILDYETRKACECLGQFASVELVHRQDQALQSYRGQVKKIQDELRQAFAQEVGFIEQVLTRNQTVLLELVHAQGAAIVLNQTITRLGQTPTETETQALVDWLLQQPPQPAFSTDSLARYYPAARSFQHKASGLLVISIFVQQTSYHILWFRPEQIQTVNWAGNPNKPVSVSEVGEMRLSPRKSFELWKETVQETSLPWQSLELEAALEMRNTLMMAVLEFSQVALEQAAERAAIANRAKSQFLAKMSHELRTPLNAILGFAQLMHRDRTLPPSLHNNVAIISRSGEHLLSLINNVLEMSKIEAGQQTLNETCFDLYRLLYSIQELFGLKATEKGLRLLVERDADLPQHVQGDEGKLRQILINLIANAIKFTAIGQVTLRVRMLPPIADSTAQMFRFEVEDTGLGIASDDLDKVFEAFMQTEQGQRQQGTGLGLAICRQFARVMGGDVMAESTLGRGSTFSCWVRLTPIAATDVLATHTQRLVVGLQPDQPHYRILVVEDVLENRQLLVQLLESIGFEVQAVENGAEAVDRWQNWNPHLIWMDIQMPTMDGHEATRRIRSQPGGDEPIIIALTANAFADDRAASLNAGCDDFVAKPFTEAMLFDKIADHLSVRYVYAEDSTATPEPAAITTKPLTPDDLTALPPAWIAQMHQAALTLDEARLEELISQLPPEAEPLAIGLRNLIEDLRLEVLVELTQPR